MRIFWYVASPRLYNGLKNFDDGVVVLSFVLPQLSTREALLSIIRKLPLPVRVENSPLNLSL